MVAERGSREHISERIAKQIVDASLDDPVEEWNLLSLAYKNAVGSRRAAWRVITSTEQKEKFKGKEELVLHAREYVAKVEGELQKIRDGILALMDKELISPPGTDELKVLYYKMKSDYYRYLAEYATDDAKGKATDSACVGHVEANKIAENDLAVIRPIRLAMALNSSVFQADVFENTDEACEMTRVAFDDAITAPVIDIPAVTQQTLIVQTVQKTMETSQLQCIDKVIDGLVVQVEHVPQSQVAEETIEIPQFDVVEKTAETTETQTIQGTQTPESLGSARVCRVAQAGTVKVVKIETPLFAESASPMFASTPVSEALSVVIDTSVLQAVEELVEASKTFSQNRVQQSSMGQIIANPAISLAEKTVEMPVTRTKEKTQHVVNTHAQHVVNTFEAETPIIIETINQVTKHVDIPQLQVVVKTIEAAKHIQQERVKELRSKFEVGHTSEVPRPIRNVQKTVEVPRVQYIDKVADIPVDIQRQVSTTQAVQDIEEVEDVTALTQSEVPNIPDDDEDWLEQESKKRKLPMPADAVSESRADESDFDRFDDLVLPSPERKTVFISIASGDEADDGPDKEQEMTRCLVQGGESVLVDETDAESPGCQMVQVVHADWAQELREERRKFTDDVASDMSDVKNELAHVRETARSSGPQREAH